MNRKAISGSFYTGNKESFQTHFILDKTAGAVFYLMRYDFINYFPIDEQAAFLVSIIMIGYGAALLLLKYLGGDRYESLSEDSYLRDELKVLRNEVAHGNFSRSEIEENRQKIKYLEKALKSFKEGSFNISEEEKNELLEAIRNGILADASESILSEIENKYSENIQLDNQLNKIQEQLENTRLRLRQEISALGRRGNVNLVIGVFTTIAAVGILTTTVLDPEVKLTKDTLISHFAPRLTLSIFIEVFSFFFLRLYKSGLSEIKYFQNELTNIEMKYVSLDVALRTKKEGSINSVINEFSVTERNFVLNKGQSTVEIERSKLEISDENTISLLSQLVEAIKK